MFTSTPSLEEDGLHSLSSKTASSAAVGTYGRFDGERSRSGGSCRDVIAHGPPALKILVGSCPTLFGSGFWRNRVFLRTAYEFKVSPDNVPKYIRARYAPMAMEHIVAPGDFSSTSSSFCAVPSRQPRAMIDVRRLGAFEPLG